MMMLPGCFMTVKLPFVEDKAFSRVLLCHFSTPIWEPPIFFDDADCFWASSGRRSLILTFSPSWTLIVTVTARPFWKTTW